MDGASDGRTRAWLVPLVLLYMRGVDHELLGRFLLLYSERPAYEVHR